MARTTDKLRLPIAVAFATSDRSNAKTKVKVFKNGVYHSDGQL